MKKNDRTIAKKIIIDIAGFSLMIIAPFLGWLPGPGGIPLFIIGLSLVATNHEWAENLLKDFDDKRRQYTDKFLRGGKVQTVAIDIFCICLIALGIYVNTQTNTLWVRGMTFGAFTLSLILLVSNQDRVDRFISLIKSRNKH